MCCLQSDSKWLFCDKTFFKIQHQISEKRTSVWKSGWKIISTWLLNNSVRTIEDDAKLDVWVFLKRNYSKFEYQSAAQITGLKTLKALLCFQRLLKAIWIAHLRKSLFLFKSIANDAEKNLEFHISFKIYWLLSEMLRLPFDLLATWRLKPQRLIQINFLVYKETVPVLRRWDSEHHDSKFGIK